MLNFFGIILFNLSALGYFTGVADPIEYWSGSIIALLFFIQAQLIHIKLLLMEK